MLFRPRRQPTFLETLRVAVWPRRSWARSLRYFRARLLRAKATPHAVGLGLAAGVFVAFLPILGVQIMVAGLLAWLGRASIVAAVVGTFAGNPLTWPFMWIGSYTVGLSLLGQPLPMTAEEVRETLSRLRAPWPAEMTLPALLNHSEATIWPVLKPFLLGSVVLGLLSATIFYCMVRRAAHVRLARRGPMSLGTGGMAQAHAHGTGSAR